jgi:hypothetical protein
MTTLLVNSCCLAEHQQFFNPLRLVKWKAAQTPGSSRGAATSDQCRPIRNDTTFSAKAYTWSRRLSAKAFAVTPEATVEVILNPWEQ